jgi:hypothetical protein
LSDHIKNDIDTSHKSKKKVKKLGVTKKSTYTLADYIKNDINPDLNKQNDHEINEKDLKSDVTKKRTFPVKLIKKKYYFDNIKDTNQYFLNYVNSYIKKLNNFIYGTNVESLVINTRIIPQYDAIEFIIQVHQLKYEFKLIDLFFIFTCCQFYNNGKSIKNCSTLYDYGYCDCDKSEIWNKHCSFWKKCGNKDYYVYKNYAKKYIFVKSEIKNIIFYFFKKNEIIELNLLKNIKMNKKFKKDRYDLRIDCIRNILYKKMIQFEYCIFSIHSIELDFDYISSYKDHYGIMNYCEYYNLRIYDTELIKEFKNKNKEYMNDFLCFYFGKKFFFDKISIDLYLENVDEIYIKFLILNKNYRKQYLEYDPMNLNEENYLFE